MESSMLPDRAEIPRLLAQDWHSERLPPIPFLLMRIDATPPQRAQLIATSLRCLYNKYTQSGYNRTGGLL